MKKSLLHFLIALINFIAISNHPIFGQVDAGLDEVICIETVSLSGSPLGIGETGFWTVVTGAATFTNSADPSTMAIVSNGANTLRWSVDNGSGVTFDDVTITNNSVTTNAGVNQIVCGTSTTLFGSDPETGSGIWTIVQGQGQFASNTSNQTTVTGLANGENKFAWTVDKNGCTDSDTVSITNNLYLAVTGNDQVLCLNQTTITAQPLVAGTTGRWTLVTGSGTIDDPTSSSTLIEDLGEGLNSFLWTVTKTQGMVTCTNSDQLDVTNNKIPSTLSGVDKTTCDNFATLSGSYPKGASSSVTGLWAAGGAGLVTIEDPTSATTLVTNLQQGINTFTWTVTDKGCTGTSTVRVTNNSFMADAGTDQTLSANSINLAASLPDASAIGTWSIISGNGTFVAPNDPSTLVTNLGFGVNTFRWTVTWNGCTASDNVNIIYNNITADAGIDQIICTDRTYLNASNPIPASGKWTISNGSGIFINSFNSNTEVTDILPGSVNIYRWTVTINGYSEFDEVIVTNGEFKTSAGNDIETCGEAVTLAAEPAGDSGTGIWTVLAGAGNFSDIYSENSVINNLAPGPNVYQWTVTNNPGCVDSDLVTVTYNLPPVAVFETSELTGCSPLEVIFTNTSTGGETFNWDFENGEQNDNSLTTFDRSFIAENGVDSVYSIKLIATSEEECKDTIVKEIVVKAKPIISFNVYPNSQEYPNATISIDNYSNQDYDKYYWDFGDGTTKVDEGYNESFMHTYGTWGDFIISLASKNGECTDTVKRHHSNS